jgi:hypothetical protein
MPISMRTLALLSICFEFAAGFEFGTPGGRQSDPSKTKSGSFAALLCAKPGVIVQPKLS